MKWGVFMKGKMFAAGALALVLAGAAAPAEATTLSEFAAEQTASDVSSVAKEAAGSSAAAPAKPAAGEARTAEDVLDALAAEDAQDAQTADVKKKKDKKPAERYALMLSDSGYGYYLDLRASRWAQLPHGDEQILDTWVKLVPEATEDEAAKDGAYTYPQKYYLAHYYVRPKTHQIQFLSELEVTGGRPDNTVQGRGYSAQNWEDLTPDSIEDEIYHGALEHVKQQRSKKNPLTAITGADGPKNVRDALEEYFRISL